MKKIITIACALGACTISARATVIDFSSDSEQLLYKPNGFSAVGHPLVTFSDTLGAHLVVYNFGSASSGVGLGVFGDDTSRLRMTFGSPMGFLGVAFGNDDPGYSAAGDRAWLELFNGATSVGLFSLVMNRDDVLNQTISGSASGFDSALFWYGNNAGSPTNLIEIVDNIEYRAVVPQPNATDVPDGGATLALLSLSLGVLGYANGKLRK